MANPEHLEILRHGMKAWNEWRGDTPDVIPDLCGAQLSYLDFSYANLSRAYMEGVSMTDAKAVEADFSLANLSAADLNSSDFSRASFNGANLSNSNLSYASLREADLRRAILSGVGLRGAHLAKAVMLGTKIGDGWLDGVIGLEEVEHWGPSSLGIETIFLTKDEIPEAFLRGCGLPDNFITYARSLTVQPIQFYSCFISYSSKDQDFTERLHADLQSKGVRCWYAPEDLKIGDHFRDRIDESIRLHDKLLLILSENSVSSPWVSDEVEAAIEREGRERRTVLFPIKIDEAVMGSEQAWAASIRRTRHIGDFTKWKDHDSYRKAFDRLLRDLKAET